MRRRYSRKTGSTLREVIMEDPQEAVVARAGEEIVCPDCGLHLATFTDDAYGPSGCWPLDFRVDLGGVSLCPCGGNFLPIPSTDNTPRPVFDGIGQELQIHLRSGAWVGWRMLGAGMLLAVLLLPRALRAQPPADVSRVGLTAFVGASHCRPTKEDKTPCAMRFAAGYRLVEWSAGRLGHGDILGFLGKDQAALGIGHRFPDYRTPGGMVVSFTAGPSYSLAYSANGLNAGHAGGFVMVTVRPEKP